MAIRGRIDSTNMFKAVKEDAFAVAKKLQDREDLIIKIMNEDTRFRNNFRDVITEAFEMLDSAIEQAIEDSKK